MAQQKDVSTPSREQREMIDEARPIRTLVNGTAAMRAAGEEYLPREVAESIDSYEKRKKRSTLFNATGKTVLDMTGKVFTKPIVVDPKAVDADMQAWFANVDNAGQSLNVFAAKAFYDALQPGIGYIYVDAPQKPTRPDNQEPTIADYQAAKWRPFFRYVCLEDLIGWKSEVINGAPTLTQIRLKECDSEPDPKNPYENVEVEQIRVVTRGAGNCIWETFRQVEKDGKKEWVLHESGTISLPEIALFPIYINRDEFMEACPPLAKLAELNIKHWQLDSDLTNIMHVACVPILFGAGFGEQDKLVIGAAEMVQSSNPDAKLTYVEHTGAAIGTAQTRLDKLELQMQTMGLQLLIDQAGGQTATGETRDNIKENSPLAMMADALEQALTQAAGAMAKLGGQTEPKPGSIKINKDFGISNAGDLQYLVQLALGGKIDNETLLEELKRRNVISEHADIETILARLDAQAPDVQTPPGKGMNLGN
ncbi:DUF4055 domain-containing protein [Bradyrhizobium sp. HKCCYLS2038]|uniref:DUF4055 domain-containing protein n=1 Tax=Bradyrhizobium sp. HKCCYLS2038 TaxID=3420764 RepID=UPI003EB713C0